MEKLRVEINLTNAAFDEDCGGSPCDETARVLHELATKASSCLSQFDGDGKPLYDANGNACGRAWLESEPMSREEALQ